MDKHLKELSLSCWHCRPSKSSILWRMQTQVKWRVLIWIYWTPFPHLINKEFSQRIFEQVLIITQVCRIGGPVKPGLLITLLLSPNWNSNYKIFSSMVVVRTRWYMSGKETYSAWKTKWPIFATQTNVQKSSLCAQYHLFQHSVQDLIRLSSMIFL